MSGMSSSVSCNQCGGEMNTYSDYKPHDYVSGECLDCGFCYYTEDSQMTLQEVNEQRASMDLPPLKRLAKKIRSI